MAQQALNRSSVHGSFDPVLDPPRQARQEAIRSRGYGRVEPWEELPASLPRGKTPVQVLSPTKHCAKPGGSPEASGGRLLIELLDRDQEFQLRLAAVWPLCGLP